MSIAVVSKFVSFRRKQGNEYARISLTIIIGAFRFRSSVAGHRRNFRNTKSE